MLLAEQRMGFALLPAQGAQVAEKSADVRSVALAGGSPLPTGWIARRLDRLPRLASCFARAVEESAIRAWSALPGCPRGGRVSDPPISPL